MVRYTGLWVFFPFSTMGAMKNNAENKNDWKCLHDQSPSAVQRPVGWQLGNWGERITEASGERREGERRKKRASRPFALPIVPRRPSYSHFTSLHKEATVE